MEDLKKKIEKVLKEDVSPELEKDGGGVELVDVKEGIAYVRFKGACVGCPMSSMTMNNVIEQILKERIPEVKAVTVA